MDYDVSLQTIAWFNERRLTDDSLIISPKFQRRPVWLEKERVSLMSTICSGLPFPEVYIQVVTDLDTGKQRYVVVDGQQRITSILMFIDGEISLLPDENQVSKTLRDLTASQQEKFWDYKVVVRSLRNTSDAEIRDLFTKLNTNNIALNDQELRNARYTGKFKLCAERLADNPFFQNIGLFTAREVRRMEDIEFVSELLLLAVWGVTNKKDLLDDAYAEFNEDFPREAEIENEFNVAVNLLNSLVTTQNASYAKTKSTFYSLFGACLEYHKTQGRKSFKNTDKIVTALTDFLIEARTNPKESNTAAVEYFDAVSRAASDKGRRVRRQEILLRLLQENDS